MYKRVSFPKFVFSDSVMDEIRRTIGASRPESGGVLGGEPATGKIIRFHFDKDAECSPVIYQVNAERINPVIDSWNAEGDHLMGIIHSHPPGCLYPSPQDIEFALRLLHRADNTQLPHFLIPIIQSAAAGEFSMRLFLVTRSVDVTVFEVPYEVVPTRELTAFPIQSSAYREIFSRVHTAYDLHRLSNSMFVAIGCGGARAFIEDMARTGLRFFILIDPDVVRPSNIATQQCFQHDVGRPKVEVLRQTILQVNPHAIVTAVQKPIEALGDEDFRTLLFERANDCQEIETRIIGGFSDDFFAQMRVNLLALQFALPSINAQVYRRGAGAEIVFTHPTITKACARCVLSKRYAAYLREGFKNDATSAGVPYYATLRLNAAKFFVAQSILHHGTKHPFWASMLERIGQRNCILLRCDPDIESTLGLQHFTKTFAGANQERLFCDDTVWLPQHPENRQNGYEIPCPDCLGLGYLAGRMGAFGDTREIVREAQMAAGQTSKS